MKVRASLGSRGAGNVLGCASREDPATPGTSLGTEVEDPVGALDDVKVVFDHDDGIPGIGKPLQDIKQLLHVGKMQACRRFVQDVEGASGRRPAKFPGKLHPLRLTTRKRGGGLAQFHVTEADFQKGAQDAGDGRHVLEDVDCFLDAHLEDVGNGLAPELHFQGLAVEPLALADFARHEDVGQELHLDALDAVALARLATATLHIEGEPPGLVAADLGFGQLGKEFADAVIDAHIGGRVGAGGAPDRILIDGDDLVEVFDTLKAVVGTGAPE